MAAVASALSFLKKSKKVTTGCPHLDSFLRGGFPCGSVTELVGESASGKTQLCLQLSIAVQLPAADGGLNGSALYVYTENYFPYRRLQQIANHMVGRRWREGRDVTRTLRSLDVNTLSRSEALNPRKPPTKAPFAAVEGAANPCNRVFLQGIQTVENLLEYLDYVHHLLTYPLLMPVKIIIIDSMAALFRSDFENNADDMKQRVSLYFQVASKLKKYAQQFNLAVVVTNQVTDSFEPESFLRSGVFGMNGTQDHDILVTSGRRVAPALALSWSHVVNTRLFMSRNQWNGDLVGRSIQIVFAPHLPNESCDFEVNSRGLQGLLSKSTGVSDKGENASPPHSRIGEVESPRIVFTPPHVSLEKNDNPPVPDSSERLYQILQSQRVLETPPNPFSKCKEGLTVEAADARVHKSSGALQFEHGSATYCSRCSSRFYDCVANIEPRKGSSTSTPEEDADML
ncbi:hypothetical protein R1sor_021732 [Riccia sorocarpa]|uniref:RecA family profile 1 domain-containing protein n=1 Tax=Riccia sorocarpa TaxID=122646 RepID=A0ABD3GLM3_9MARC